MKLETPFTIAAKELKVLRRKKSIIYSVVIIPILLSALFSLVIRNQVASGNQVGSGTLALGLESLIYFFVVLAAILPSSIAAYSIVGEKVEKSLEPLLATPTTDGEILLGKSIAAFVPPILATWAGASIFMAAADYILYNGLSYYYFPNWSSGVMLLLLAPLAAIFSIELTVIASSRVSDVRSANQIGILMNIPFMAVFLAGATGLVTLNIDNLLIFSGIVLIADAALFFLSTSTFNREEILTKWK
jgi:ABC-2 type transport system permease protein